MVRIDIGIAELALQYSVRFCLIHRRPNQPHTLAYPVHMRIHRQSGLVKSHGCNHIGGLSAHARQPLQPAAGSGLERFEQLAAQLATGIEHDRQKALHQLAGGHAAGVGADVHRGQHMAR